MKNAIRTIGVVVLILLILGAVALLIVTRPAFVRVVVIPRAEAQLDAIINVQQIRVSPSGNVLLQDLQIKRQQRQPFILETELLRARFELLPLLRGRVHFRELMLSNGRLQVSAPPQPSPKPFDLEALAETLAELLELPPVTAERISINQFSLSYDSLQEPFLVRLDDADLQLANFMAGETARLTWHAVVQVHSADSIRISHGNWSGNAWIEINTELQLRRLQLQSIIDDLQGWLTHTDLAEASAELALQMQASPAVPRLELSEIQLNARQAQQPLLALSGSGFIDFADSEQPRLELALQTSAMPLLLSIVLAEAGSDYRLHDQTRLHYQARLQGLMLQHLEFYGNLQLQNWLFTAPADQPRTTEALNLRAEHRLQVYPERLKVTPATAQLEPAPLAELEKMTMVANDAQGDVVAQLQAAGRLMLPQAETPSQLQLSLSNVDLRQWQQLLWLPNESEPDAAANNGDSAADATTDLRAMISALTLPLHVVTELRLQDCSYDQLQLYAATAEVVLQPERLALRNLDIHCNFATLNARAQLELVEARLRYQAEVRLRNIETQPLLQMFRPQLTNSIRLAVNTATLSMQGFGNDLDAWKRHLNASVSIDGASLALRDMPWLDNLAARLQFPALRDLQFERSAMTMQIADGQILLPRATLRSEELVLVANGTMGFDQSIDLRLLPGLNAAMLEAGPSAMIHVFFNEVRDGYRYPAVALQISGTLTEPEFTIPYEQILPPTLEAIPGLPELLPWSDDNDNNDNNNDANGIDEDPEPPNLRQQLEQLLPRP